MILTWFSRSSCTRRRQGS